MQVLVVDIGCTKNVANINASKIPDIAGPARVIRDKSVAVVLERAVGSDGRVF